MRAGSRYLKHRLTPRHLTLLVIRALRRNIMKKLLIRWTYKIWHKPLCRIIGEAYSKGIINSYQMHELLARFDRTQKKHYLMEKKAV